MKKSKTKYCSSCEQDLEISEFHKNRARKDGLQQECKKCASERNKKLKEDFDNTVSSRRPLYLFTIINGNKVHKYLISSTKSNLQYYKTCIVETLFHAEETYQDDFNTDIKEIGYSFKSTKRGIVKL